MSCEVNSKEIYRLKVIETNEFLRIDECYYCCGDWGTCITLDNRFHIFETEDINLA